MITKDKDMLERLGFPKRPVILAQEVQIRYFLGPDFIIRSLDGRGTP